MKRLVIAIIIILGFQYADAQVGKDSTTKMKDSIPAYERNPTIPSFSIEAAPDSSAFTNHDLKHKKPLIIVIFSPDCDHCKHFTKELLAKYDMVKHAQIVMVSALNYNMIKKFYDDYKIADYPSIKMGRDTNYTLGNFMGVRMFPTLIVYDKHGNFLKRLDTGITVEKIAELL
ncbi:MAG: thioredoxin family protein [Ferruginibacter sp.]